MWFRAACPVRPAEQAWMEESLDWLMDEFGPGPLTRPAMVPSDDLFDGEWTTTEDTIDPADIAGDVLVRICAYMGVDPARVVLDFGAAEGYRERAGQAVVTVASVEPVRLVASIAYELGLVLLVGDRRIEPSRPDVQALAELLTVYFGLGVFGANAALGRLTPAMYGYALARYAWLRGEARPDWADHLNIGPATYLRKGLRYLRTAAA